MNLMEWEVGIPGKPKVSEPANLTRLRARNRRSVESHSSSSADDILS